MIEKYIKNEQTLKKWRAFKRRRVGVISCVIILISCFFSFTAEFWANSKPIYLSYRGKSYFPVFASYSAKDFGLTDSLNVNYKKLKLSDSDSAIWPIIKWDPYESNKDVESYPSPPSAINIMGTDDRGRDVFTRLLYGLRYSIFYSLRIGVRTTTMPGYLR